MSTDSDDYMSNADMSVQNVYSDDDMDSDDSDYTATRADTDEDPDSEFGRSDTEFEDLLWNWFHPIVSINTHTTRTQMLRKTFDQWFLMLAQQRRINLKLQTGDRFWALFLL